MKVITLDKEIFEKAFNLCHKHHTDQEIVQILDGHDDVEKQIAILQIENVANLEYAKKLISHLTNQDGPIREVTAIKLRELLIEKNNEIIDKLEFYPHFANAVCDVNPNICRFVIEFLPVLKQREKMVKILINKIDNIFRRIANPDKEQKNFLTVRLFNLYWSFEALGELLPLCNSLQISGELSTKLNTQLKRAIEFKDYTIDEKVAKILTCSFPFAFGKEIKDELKQSQNFYVKRYFTDDKD